MSAHDIHPDLPAWLAALDDRLGTLFRDEDALLREAADAGVGSRGKRVRPTVLLLACRAFGPVTERAYRQAMLVELVHAASLAHDDVLDDAAERRGAPSLASRWGGKFSILVGDFLLARVFELATEDNDFRLMGLLAGAATAMTRAVTLELTALGLDADEATYWRVVQGKTAALFAGAAAVGAALGGATPAEQAALRRYGEAFGCAFQTADDLLDVEGVAGASGKPQGADWRQGRATLPLLHVMATAPAAVRAEIRARWQAGLEDAEALAALRTLVADHGGLAYGWARAQGFREEALAALAAVPDGPGRRGLARLCQELFPLPVLPAAEVVAR